jgi:hypothetical protein
MKEQTMKRLAIAAAMCVLAVVVGCGKSASFTSPSGEKINVKEKGDNVEWTAQGADGKKTSIASGKNVKLSEGYPSNVVPMYPGATITTSMDMGDQNFMVALQTGDNAEKVTDWYEKKLKESGSKIETSMNMEKMNMRAGKNGEWAFSVQITADDNNKTIATVTVHKEK